MKMTNRVELYLCKKLPNGVLEQFCVVVLRQNEAEARKRYEQEGYRVK